MVGLSVCLVLWRMGEGKSRPTGLLVLGRHVSGLRKSGGGREGEIESSSSRSDVARDPHMSCIVKWKIRQENVDLALISDLATEPHIGSMGE